MCKLLSHYMQHKARWSKIHWKVHNLNSLSVQSSPAGLTGSFLGHIWATGYIQYLTHLVWGLFVNSTSCLALILQPSVKHLNSLFNLVICLFILQSKNYCIKTFNQHLQPLLWLFACDLPSFLLVTLPFWLPVQIVSLVFSYPLTLLASFFLYWIYLPLS